MYLGCDKMNGESVMTTSVLSVRHFFVVNPVSFDNRQKMEAMIAGVHRFFNDLKNSLPGVPPDYAVHISRFPRDAICAIQRFSSSVSSGVPLRVYAMGGDGILFDCLNGVIGLQNTELGIMPYGKGSDFYRVFGEENRDIFNSLETQTRAPSVPMDALYCGSNYALNHCLIGLEALSSASIRGIQEGCSLLDRFSSAFSRIIHVSSVPVYLAGVMNPEILRQNYRIWIDDDNLSGTHAFINIVNSSWYGANKYAIPEADPTDGWLDVVMCHSMSVLDMFKVFHHYMNGYRAKYPNQFTWRRAKKIFLTSTQPLVLDLDGETFYDKYISVEIKPGIVRIIDPTQVQ
jgi:diacylglycerol kinase family enzyme